MKKEYSHKTYYELVPLRWKQKYNWNNSLSLTQKECEYEFFIILWILKGKNIECINNEYKNLIDNNYIRKLFIEMRKISCFFC